MSQVELPNQVPAPGNLERVCPGRTPMSPPPSTPFVDRGPFGVAVFDTDLRFILVSQGLATSTNRTRPKLWESASTRCCPSYGDLVAGPLRQTLESGIPILDVETWGTFADPAAERSFISSFYRLDSSSGTALGVVVLITGRRSSATPRRRPDQRPNSSSFSNK